jgi:demethylmenaquinone methyltransferase/2-methoxy-6-polyprenyl-1,4-benzoquinol methylase
MSQLAGEDRAIYVHQIFGSIAKRYTLMNRLMTAGQDAVWRRRTIQLARLAPEGRLLDLGTGTGDLGREALRQQPGIRLAAVDFSREMMLAGQRISHLPWINADALCLPFPDQVFDAVVSGFLLRNVGDLDRALNEQHRILKNGGWIVILETTRPQAGLLTPLVWIHMHLTIPWLGGLITGEPAAYRYLPASSEAFMDTQTLAHRLGSSGFQEVQFQRLMFGTIAIHWARKK